MTAEPHAGFYTTSRDVTLEQLGQEEPAERVGAEFPQPAHVEDRHSLSG